jgi:hypothetical protein
MSEIIDAPPDEWIDEESTSNGNGAPSSVFSMLRAKRAAHTAEQTYDIAVPGYEGALVLRCGPLSGAKFTVFRERHERSRSPERDFNLNADMLLAAVRDVLARATPDGELQSLDSDDPIGLDERLAHGLGLRASTGRELARELFALAPIPEVALNTLMGGYMEWATGVNSDADESFAGESAAATR